MDFERRKASTLASLGCSETDKSPKGTLDAPIIQLIDLINSHPSYFTTSSCSGRISILSQPSPQTLTLAQSRPKKKASGGSWLYITHDPADPDSVVDLLFPAESTSRGDGDSDSVSDLVFRFEPFILAVECIDVSSAQSLVSAAIASGFRESGITNTGKRVIVAVRCSIRLEIPLGTDREILVSREYVRFVVALANDKMAANRRRTDGFYQALLRSGGFGAANLADGCENGLVCEGDNGGEEAEVEPEGKEDGFGEVPSSSLSVVKMEINGEPIEKLFLWGHSACNFGDQLGNKVIVFGGFGGMGRHGRRNGCFLLDPLTGMLEAIDVAGGPSPRLGHTASVIGNYMFVIGGRAGPVDILNDVWVFNIVKKDWKFLECCGDAFFPPRHRHAAVVVGQKIYVFGGLNGETVSSSLHVLDTVNMQWKELNGNGEKPSARHSHTMVAYGSQLFMFGGYDGEKALGDLFSLNMETLQWKKEEVAGRCPHPRFSHSMFVYGNHIGVIGGCPVQQHFQELSVLDLRFRTWRHIKLDSSGEALFLRSTANVLSDDLIVIGGGAACYAFGTKFSEPLKIYLLPLISLDSTPKPVENRKICDSLSHEVEKRERDLGFQNMPTEHLPSLTVDPGMDLRNELALLDDSSTQYASSYWVLQVERKHAKTVKDILKKFGWLDLARKVYSREDGIHICFPVNQHFCNIFDSFVSTFATQDDFFVKAGKVEGLVINDVTCLKALNSLKGCGATKLADEVVQVRKSAKSPFQLMNEAVASLIKDRDLPATLLEELPTRWERLGDIVVLPVSSFKNPLWNSIEKELWPTIAKSLNTHRLARQGRVASTGTRDSTLEILLGDGGWVDHRENGIFYSFDATKCMFSWGNLSEKQRMARLGCIDEVIVDLFAGIGYFVLPFLIGSKAKLVYACEWNPHAVEALKRNLHLNCVEDRCIVLEGDNRITAPKGVANRVCLGLIPTSEGSWVTAVRALRPEGGVLHIHGNVNDSAESSWTQHVSNSISEIARSEGLCWDVSVEHLERVKWYAPHIRHLVADVRCKPKI